MSNHSSAELVLGTAQLGMAYGVANRTGHLSTREAELILHSAAAAGVKWFDTAASYGSSERRLGSAFPASRGVRIVTKLQPFDQFDDSTPVGAIRQAVVDCVRRSCARLGTDRLDVLLLHRPHHLNWRNAVVWNTVKELRDADALFDLGVSAYTPDEVMAALRDRDVRHIQLPFNVLDWRWRKSGAIQALANSPGVTVHARSALLQGLLAADPEVRWPEGVDPTEFKARLLQLAQELDRDSPADLCLAYVRAQTWIHGIVVGMENLRQLALNVALFGRPPLNTAELAIVDAALPRATEQLLNPVRWIKAA